MLGTAACMLFHFVAFSYMNYIYSPSYGAPNMKEVRPCEPTKRPLRAFGGHPLDTGKLDVLGQL